MITGRNEIVELRFSDGSRLRCTPGHRIWTANRGWVHAEELTPTTRWSAPSSTPAPMADNRLPMQACSRSSTRDPKLLKVPSKWDDEFAHYLGWLIGDGCIDTPRAER